LIIGGGGGIGLALLNRLCSRFGAKVAVMGRRPDVEVSGYMAMTEQFGNQLLYLQGHVNDEADLQRVLGEVREHFGRLDGVIHAAMVLQDKRLADMSEADFQKVLEPKVAGIQALSKAVQTQRLDFLLVFSSLQSFVGNVAQGNYATASTYLDGYACAMRQSCSFPVFVVNWGVWGEVGAVATEAHRQLLARQGMICMATEDAFNWLEKSLAAGWQQTVIAAAQAEVLEALGCVENQEILTREPAFRPEAIDPPGINWSAQRLRDVNTEFTLIKDAIERLVNLALRRIAAIFRDELKLTRERSVWRKAGILEEYQALVAALFDLLPERLAEVEALPQEAFEAAVDELNRKFELLQPFAGLLSACMAAYSDVLTGKVRAADVVFPQGRIDAVRAVYADTAVCGFYNNLVAELATECADQLDRPLRILEIGAGTGATTQAVADRLNRLGKRYEYHYTELWDVLLEDAKLRLADDYPEVSFGFLDINFDPRDQGYSDPFDVVIATNVLHATRNLAVSLQNVKLLLSSGGRLLLNESLEVQAYSTLIFGLLPGWWHATDVAERLPNSPLVSRQGWKTLLREAGFSAIGSCLPSGCDAGALGAQDVFHAVSDGEALVARTTKRHRQAAASDITFRHSASLGLPDALPPMMEPVPWTDLGMSSDVAPSCLKLYRDPHRNLWLFLDNPPANFFTDKCLGELCSVLDALRKNSGLLHKPLLYISHFGNYFSLGGERSQIASWVSERRTDALRAFAEKARQLLVAISTLEAVVIAVVDGTAQGGGFETLLAADLQVVRKGVALGLSEIKSGLVPGMGGMSYLQSQIGMASLKRILICGSSFSAQEAYALGLISHLADDPFTDALTLGEQLDHLQTAVLIKQRLNQNASEALTADIDYWLEYLLRHSELIDEKRIESSEFVVANQAVQATNYSTI
jgi:enoyl-CoA hydratase/carnithine racemase/NAD(P)-dependent dehydrogenase (short-subunit alcohol dehydrogenase family)